MNDNQRKLVQRLGEDCAYTFKGLYKQADILDFKYRLYLSIPIIFSVTALGFDDEIPTLLLKALAVLSLVVTVLALMEQKDFEKSGRYREYAEKVKTLYDNSEQIYHLEVFDKYEATFGDWQALKEALKDYPVSARAYKTTQKRIKAEMNLTWLDGEYGKNS